MEKNVFKDIEPHAKLPEKVKTDVLSSIESLKLIMDFWDLLAAKRVQMNLNMANQRELNKVKNPEIKE